MIVGRSARRSGSIASASQLRARTTRAPADRAAKVHTNEPTCDIDEPGRKASSGVSSNAAAALAHIQLSVSCVCVTPFAGPGAAGREEDARGSPGRAAVAAGRRGGEVLEAAAGRLALPRTRTTPRQLAGEGAGGDVGRPLGVDQQRRGPDTSRAWSISRAV